MSNTDNNKIIHLFITNSCDHDCPLCCNKQYEIDEIPVVTVEELKYADTILLTGGEPFLIDGIDVFVDSLRNQFKNIKNVYAYTSGTAFYHWLHRGGDYSLYDGINLSPKSIEDLDAVSVLLFSPIFNAILSHMKSNRIYLFPNMRKAFDSKHLPIPEHTEVVNRKWQENFTAQSGIFRRLPILF